MTGLVVAAAALLLTLAPSSLQERPAAAQEVAPYLPVTIQAVPPIEGVRLVLDGRSLTTDHNGLALARLRRPGSHNLTAPDLQRVEPGVRVHFAHWSDGDFPSVRRLSVTTFTSLEVGFDVSYSTPVNFVSTAGDPIVAERIDSLTIVDDRDTGYSLATDGPQWLPGSRARESAGSIRSEEISYAVDAVVAGGRDRLAPGQPRFSPSPERSWSIVLEGAAGEKPLTGPSAARGPRATNHVVVSVSDALFGFPTGSAVSIEGPDGRSERHQLGPGVRLSLEEAGAGDFRATALGPGISFAQRFDPSRAERVRLSVITYLDIATGLLTLVLVAAGVLALARRIGSPKPQRGSPIARARPWFSNTRDRAKAAPRPAPARGAGKPDTPAASEPGLVPTARPTQPAPTLASTPEPVPAVEFDMISDPLEPATTPASAEVHSRAIELAAEAEAELAEARDRAREIVAEAENSLTAARKRAREIMQRAVEEAHRQTIELKAQAEAAVAEAREQAVEIMGEAASDARGLREMAEREAAELLRHALRRRNEIQDSTGRESGGQRTVTSLEDSDLEDSTEPPVQPRPGVTIKISDVSLLEDQVEPAPARPGRH